MEPESGSKEPARWNPYSDVLKEVNLAKEPQKFVFFAESLDESHHLVLHCQHGRSRGDAGMRGSFDVAIQDGANHINVGGLRIQKLNTATEESSWKS